MVKLPRPYELMHVSVDDTSLLEQFISAAGESLNSFRYFAQRELSSLENHLCTLLICKSGKPLAYGHLDREKDTTWLGIAVVDEARGKGLGSMMMQQLINQAHENKVQDIRLSVDNDNRAAIDLYRRFMFKTVEKRETLRFMERPTKILEVAVSTLALRKLGFDEAVRCAEEQELFFEFSSGMPFQDKLIDRFLNAEIRRMPHNYFPPPKEEFVLNLASADEQIRERSVDHCKANIERCSKVRAPFYAAHAGFCYDPDPTMLGQKITVEMTKSKEEHWRLFALSINEILDHAERYRMPFLIENNVIIEANMLADGTNPLLCCEQNDLLTLLNIFEHPLLGILLDTAHLKVSCQTLGLDRDKEVESLLPVISAVHHSDNDGTVDNNQAMPDDYWFLPYMKNLDDKVHVVEVKDLEIKEVEQQIALLNSSVY